MAGIYSDQPLETTRDVVPYSVAQRLQGMPHFPVKFTGALNAQCLQGMPHSTVKFTGALNAQCLQCSHQYRSWGIVRSHHLVMS